MLHKKSGTSATTESTCVKKEKTRDMVVTFEANVREGTTFLLLIHTGRYPIACRALLPLRFLFFGLVLGSVGYAQDW